MELAWSGLAAVRVWCLLALQPHLRRALGWLWWLHLAVLSLPIAHVVRDSLEYAAMSGSGDRVPSAASFWLELLAIELVIGVVVGAALSLVSYGCLGGAARSWRVACGDSSEVLPALFMTWLSAGMWASALSLGLHRPILLALADLFTLLPVGGAFELGAWSADALGWAGDAALAMCTLALGFAAPALLAGVVVEAAARLMLTRDPHYGEWQSWWPGLLRCAVVLIALGGVWALRGQWWLASAVGLG